MPKPELTFLRFSGHRIRRPGALPVRGWCTRGRNESAADWLSFDGGEQVALGSNVCWIADLVNKFRLHGSGAAMPYRPLLCICSGD